MTSREGALIGYFSAGTASLSRGKVDASHENSMQYVDTKANWMRVKVAGLSKAVRIVLEEVLVRAEDQYHMTQSPYRGGKISTRSFLLSQGRQATYNQLPRKGCAESLGELVGVLAHAGRAHPVDGIADAACLGVAR